MAHLLEHLNTRWEAYTENYQQKMFGTKDLIVWLQCDCITAEQGAGWGGGWPLCTNMYEGSMSLSQTTEQVLWVKMKLEGLLFSVPYTITAEYLFIWITSFLFVCLLA